MYHHGKHTPRQKAYALDIGLLVIYWPWVWFDHTKGGCSCQREVRVCQHQQALECPKDEALHQLRIIICNPAHVTR